MIFLFFMKSHTRQICISIRSISILFLPSIFIVPFSPEELNYVYLPYNICIYDKYEYIDVYSLERVFLGS